MSHAAVDSEVLLWFMAALTVLLVTFIGVVIKTPPRTADSPQPPELSSAVPPRPGLAGRPQATGLAGAAVRSGRAGYRPRHAEGIRPELMVTGRRQMSGRPPWGPAPRPPGLADRDTVPWRAVPGPVPRYASAYRTLPPGTGLSPRACSPAGARGGAHRQAPRHGAHRAGIGAGQVRGSAGRTGRHRAGGH